MSHSVYYKNVYFYILHGVQASKLADISQQDIKLAIELHRKCLECTVCQKVACLDLDTGHRIRKIRCVIVSYLKDVYPVLPKA